MNLTHESQHLNMSRHFAYQQLRKLQQQRVYALQDRVQAVLNNAERLFFYGIKRTIDILGAGILLVVLSPVWLTLAFLIYNTDKGPVFFSQTRVGRYGQTFRLWKFRSMYVDAEARRQEVIAQARQSGEMQDLRFKMKNDPRITPIGKILRRLSLDELPQLINILRGDMSLVGPRPPIPEEVQAYSFNEHKRLWVKPGLTCIWQVSGRSNIAFPQQVELDKAYIAQQSLSLDFQLLYRTVGAVVTGRGAY
jgi:lipopolysaccharide/colanic/teichoic acid biosynthesis glycosyltransferase